MCSKASFTTGKPLDPCRLAVLRLRQATILVTGILTAATGSIFVCNILALPQVSWPVVGLMLCATGVLQLYAGLQFRGYLSFAAWGIAAAFYILFGLFALTGPPPQLAVLAIFFFAGVIGTGLIRAYCGYIFRAIRSSHWLIAGGTMTIGIGCFLALQWPNGDLALAGLLLALDLALYGIGLAGFSLQLGERLGEPIGESKREPPKG